MNNVKKKSPTVINIQVGASNRNHFWGSKNWLDENGNPKPEHMYNKEYLYEKVTEQIEF